MSKRVVIDNIRSINHLDFTIPNSGVHLLTGENGCGKTTLLTCLSRICNSYAFQQGFPSKNATNYDEYSGSISYYVNETFVNYTKRNNGKWLPNTNGDIFNSFGYQSVVNISTKSERIFTQEIVVPRRQSKGDPWIIEGMNSILNTNRFSNMVRITVGDLRSPKGKAEQRRRNTAFAICQSDGSFYTERNFSFGEIVLLNLLYDLEKVEPGSLVLIDELELALHPSAQIRLLERIIRMASEKKLTIIIPTHSSSLIGSQKSVILLELGEQCVNVIYGCPPAKAIGAIGMKEDTMPDIIIFVEDDMAKSLLNALLQTFNRLNPEFCYLDIRVIEVGDYKNIMNFYKDASSYIFYSNVFLTAFMDKDVETDIIPFPQYCNHEFVALYEQIRQRMHYLPFTPEVLLYQEFTEYRNQLLNSMHTHYQNQQLNYVYDNVSGLVEYTRGFPTVSNQDEYNSVLSDRGKIRKKCKQEVKKIANSLSEQSNISDNQIYRFVFHLAVERLEGNDLNVNNLLITTMKRLS